MSKVLVPASLKRIWEMSARIPSPAGARYAAKTANGATKLYLYEPIGEDMFESGVSAERVAKDLDDAHAKGSRSLEVYINSPGGIIGDGMSIYSAIRRFQGSRTVYVDGWAASIASVIALAGDRVISAPGSTWMIHEPMGGLLVFGRRDELKDAYGKTDAALAALHESILDLYESRTKQPRAELDKWMRAEKYMTAREAVECGFSDEVAEAMEPEARAPAMTPAPAAPPPRARSAEELYAQAVADAEDLKRRFPAASRGSQSPGQPGAPTNVKPGNRQETNR